MKVTREDTENGDEFYRMAEKEIPAADQPQVAAVIEALNEAISPMFKEFNRTIREILPPLENTVMLMMTEDGHVASILSTAPPEMQIEAFQRAIVLIEAMKKKKES